LDELNPTRIERLGRDLETWLNGEDDAIERLDQAAMFEAFADPAIYERMDPVVYQNIVYFMTAYYVPIQGTQHLKVAERLKLFLHDVVGLRRADAAEARARWHLFFWFDDASQVEELCRSVRGKQYLRL
jgi:hypothetical protein